MHYPQSRDTTPGSFQSGHAAVNDINMYYEIHGEQGMPIVLIHGGGSTIETSFSNFMPALLNRYKLIAVELQAHGRTSDRQAVETFVQDADDVAALLRFLGIEQATILGFSNGGTTSLQLAIRHPELVNKVVAISAVYQKEGIVAGLFEGLMHATLESMPQALKDGFIKVNPDIQKLNTMFEKDKQRMLGFTDISDEDISNIKAPVLIISNDKDIVMPEHALKMTRLIQNAKLVILPGVHGSAIGETCVFVEGSNLHHVTAHIVIEFIEDRLP